VKVLFVSIISFFLFYETICCDTIKKVYHPIRLIYIYSLASREDVNPLYDMRSRLSYSKTFIYHVHRTIATVSLLSCLYICTCTKACYTVVYQLENLVVYHFACAWTSPMTRVN